MSPFISKPNNFSGGGGGSIDLSNVYTKAEIDVLLTGSNEKVMTFTTLKEVVTGIFNAHVSFPFDGVITEVTAICSVAGQLDTLISIEKSVDMINWVEISNLPIVIKQNEYYDDHSHTLLDSIVNKGDTFRLVIKQSGNISNLAVNIKVKYRK